jgi:flagellin-specific chaperone FliS
MRPNVQAIQAYQRDKIAHSSRKELLEAVYDVGYRACCARDGEKARKVLYELSAGLDFSQKKMANQHFQIYQYMIGLTYEGKFDEAAGHFKTIRDAWREVIRREREES